MTLLDHDPLAEQAQHLAANFSRRSFIAKATAISLAAVGGLTFAQRAIAVAAPLQSTFSSHCVGGYHAGSACSGGTCPGIWGQCWWSCCSNLCSGLFTEFCDCCVTGSGSGKTPSIYCPEGYVFSCKKGSCTNDPC